MKEIIAQNIHCIYLDQYATTGIFENESPIWKELKLLLFKASESNRIICPKSPEHFLESSQKESLKAKDLDSKFSKLSKGYAFKADLFITSQLLISKIRKNNITGRTYFEENVKPDILMQDEKLNRFINLKKQFDEKINEGSVFNNEIRKSAGSNRPNKYLKQDLLKAIKSLSENEFIIRLQDLLNEGGITIRGVKFPSGEIPNWIDSVIHWLLIKHKMSKDEAKQLRNHLKENGFSQIPTLDIKHSLMAFVAVENKIELPSDQIDYMRISAGLPVSDILLTDKKRKYEILTLGLDKKYKTKVLCGTEKDLLDFKMELENILK
jgi:hypothetical protein